MISKLKFFSEASKIKEQDMVKNKYLYNAYKKGLYNYRIMTVGDIARNKWTTDDVPRYILEYIKDNTEVILIANIIKKSIAQIQIRAVRSKSKRERFKVFGKQTSIPYGLGMLDNNFTYGDWLILVEGTSDRDVLIEFYPNVIAVLTDGLSMVQKNLIKNLTNRMIIMYDNDDAGYKGYYRDRKWMKENGIDVKNVSYPSGMNDPGDLAEYRYLGKYYEAEQMEEHLKIWLNNIIENQRVCPEEG